MALPSLPDAAIQLGATAPDWRAAVELAGACLTRSGAADPGYADEMVRMIDEHGPYVVIAPGLALAHARPGPAVLRDGLAVVTLATPVEFGHPHNDPVRVVLALAAHSPTHHLGMVAELANLFNHSDAVERLSDATTPEGVRAILGATA
ncbi:MAG TPA: PTS sugar transporter subunit IIA [Pseudolysinimonas sp.]|jgi:PTS system ascorbate-specific IIA component